MCIAGCVQDGKIHLGRSHLPFIPSNFLSSPSTFQLEDPTLHPLYITSEHSLSDPRSADPNAQCLPRVDCLTWLSSSATNAIRGSFVRLHVNRRNLSGTCEGACTSQSTPVGPKHTTGNRTIREHPGNTKKYNLGMMTKTKLFGLICHISALKIIHAEICANRSAPVDQRRRNMYGQRSAKTFLSFVHTSAYANQSDSFRPHLPPPNLGSFRVELDRGERVHAFVNAPEILVCKPCHYDGSILCHGDR